MASLSFVFLICKVRVIVAVSLTLLIGRETTGNSYRLPLTSLMCYRDVQLLWLFFPRCPAPTLTYLLHLSGKCQVFVFFFFSPLHLGLERSWLGLPQALLALLSTQSSSLSCFIYVFPSLFYYLNELSLPLQYTPLHFHFSTYHNLKISCFLITLPLNDLSVLYGINLFIFLFV